MYTSNVKKQICHPSSDFIGTLLCLRNDYAVYSKSTYTVTMLMQRLCIPETLCSQAREWMCNEVILSYLKSQ